MKAPTFIALTTALAALPAYAALQTGEVLGTEATAIRAALEAQGYIVEEIEFEADEIEAEILIDGVEFEVEIDPATGMILEVMADDEDDGDDNEEDEDEDETDDD